jgi:predicted glycosyltransferase involved in capsule biosynthesis
MNDDTHEFCQEKIRILQEYVSKGEEILSSIENWESLAGILEERDQLIEKLQHLEKQLNEKKDGSACTLDQKKRINNLVKLILDIDQNCIQLIKDEQKKTIQELKNNQKSQKVAGYEISLTPNYGTFLDAKK